MAHGPPVFMFCPVCCPVVVFGGSCLALSSSCWGNGSWYSAFFSWYCDMCIVYNGLWALSIRVIVY